MLYLSLFLAGFTLGVFVALRMFAPEQQEESWDPQHFPQTATSIGTQVSKRLTLSKMSSPQISLQFRHKSLPLSS